MFATYDSRNTIPRILKSLGASIGDFAALQYETSYSRAQVERWLRAESSTVEERPMLKLAIRLAQLQKLYPVRLNWRDRDNIKLLLEKSDAEVTAEHAAEKSDVLDHQAVPSDRS